MTDVTVIGNTGSGSGMAEKVAVTFRAELTTTVQAPVPEQPPPDQPAKMEPPAGDAVSGPASVIEAVAHGNRVAKEVEVYLRTGRREKVDIPLEAHLPPLTWDMEQYSEALRLRLPWIPVAARQGSFREVELSAPEKEIRAECRRCLRCDIRSEHN